MNLTDTYVGGSHYFPDHQEGSHPLLIAVLCEVGGLPTPLHARLDTGSHWCILPPNVARDLNCDLEPDPSVSPLHSRFGLLPGRLERLPLRLLVTEGEDVEIEATCFLSRDWSGPMVIGWKGGLERLRFALDPADNAFYLAEL